MLVVAVGSVNNTFGIKGVTEHTMAFRGIRDATALRRQVSECFERAALPHTPPEVGADSVVTLRRACRGAMANTLLWFPLHAAASTRCWVPNSLEPLK